jgi:hypothetical protein
MIVGDFAKLTKDQVEIRVVFKLNGTRLIRAHTHDLGQ